MHDEPIQAQHVSRSLRTHEELRRLIHPQSIAIVGASPNPGSFGARTLANLARYPGRVYPVNARYQQIGERPCHASVEALPESPDCVVIATPRAAVEPVVRACIARKAGGIVLYASGYAETGAPDRIAEQQCLAALLQEAGLPLIGPNTIGIANLLIDAPITFSAVPNDADQHGRRIGIVSQSGALGFALAQAIARGVAISHVHTAGNSIDVDVADQVAYLVEEPHCAAIACLFEGLAQPERLRAAADLAWRHDKPLVVCKIATGSSGAVAALSHTGSLAGAQSAYRATFRRAGVVMVDDIEALIETAAFFAKAPAPTARGVAVVATSGGAAIMAADQGELHGIPLPQPADAVQKVLASHIPEFGSARNPCDVTAQVLADPQMFGACADALLSDGAFGALVAPQVYAYDLAIPRIKTLSDLALNHGKIACSVWLTQWLEGPGAREAERSPGLALFRSMGRCFATFAQWHWRHARRIEGDRPLARLSPTGAADEAARVINTASTPTMGERDSKRILAGYGIPVVAERLVQSADEAVDAADALGYPVALKVDSAAILHKTEAGVVKLGLVDAQMVRAAFAIAMENASRAGPAGAIRGVLIQPMVTGGVEVMVGARIDPLFGPVVIAGIGGVMVEVFKDVATALAPLSIAEASEMLRSLKGARLLNGFRGAVPVDIDRLAHIVVRIGELAADQSERLSELDVNPLVCAGERIVAVDSLLVCKRAG